MDLYNANEGICQQTNKLMNQQIHKTNEKYTDLSSLRIKFCYLPFVTSPKIIYVGIIGLYISEINKNKQKQKSTYIIL